MPKTLIAAVLWLCVVGLAQAAPEKSVSPAEILYIGHIVTMAGGGTDDPRARAEAVAVSGSQIVAVGSRAELMRYRGRDTRVVELGSAVLLPGFIDAHGHLVGTANSLGAVNLSAAPVGQVHTIADLQAAVRRFIAEGELPAGSIVVGFGYDDAQLEERRHPTRDDLDAVSTEHPIFLSHVSGHLSALNSAMLRLAGIDASTPDPQGGVIRRRAGSREPDGVLEEKAVGLARSKVPLPGTEDSLRLLTQALRYYASFGVTSVQDAGVVPPLRGLLEEAARRDLLTLDVATYQLWSPVTVDLGALQSVRTYDHGLKHVGIKLILDGSPQGKTAFLSQPYIVPPAGQNASYAGYPSMQIDAIKRAVGEAASRGVPVIAHANGDAAAAMLIEAVAAVKKIDPTSRPNVVMIHAQTVREDQLDQMSALGITPSFFVGHTYYWGDWHRDETLGPSRADRISPARSAIERGLSFTLHTDSPVVPPDMLQTLWSATTRRSRSGDILGPMQRLTTWEALLGITLNAARQQGDEAIKGSIEAGKQADFVLLSSDPLAIDPERLRTIKVLETIARGKTVWRVASGE